MATQDRTVAFLLDQLGAVDGIAARKMFGEYGLSCNGKPIGVICDDQLFLKITAPGRAIAEGAEEVPPYRGAKPSLRIEPERWDDAEWLAQLVLATAAALPEPKPKTRKAR
jgi:TfoX/Sxy family transcriptional regulator of competence genes